MTNSNRLFYGSCFALITTAFSFSIRAGILPQLGEEFLLDAKQLGFINSMWFLGFPISEQIQRKAILFLLKYYILTCVGV